MNNIAWKLEAEQIVVELAEIRKKIHRDPEIGGKEFHTAALVEAVLQDCGIETVRPTPTSVVGLLRGAHPGDTVALRADIDALPVQEETGVEFASKIPGMMHACGHDVHTTCLLGAAKLLSAHREELCGNVKFFFQHDEEGNGGAKPMIEAGCMENPKVSAVFGAHVAPDLPLGTIGLRDGKFYAANDFFYLKVVGKGCHGAKPASGNNPLRAASDLLLRLQQLPEHFPEEKTVLSVCTFQAGTKANIIPDHAELSGTIRTLGHDTRAAMKNLFMQAVSSVEEAYAVRVEVRDIEAHPGIVNTDEMTTFVRQTLGQDFTLCELTEPTMISEDFGFFVDASRGSFYHFGTGGDHELHSARFLPPESLLPLGAAVHASVAWNYLAKQC